jgi:hypothetical protein
MKKLVLLIFLSTQIIVGFGQTTIQGIINSDVTLTMDKSPYLVIGDLVVFPKWKLTIEPGVELRFANSVRLQIRGTLEALGTEADSISFFSDTGTSMGLWTGIEILNTLGGNASFDYCKFSHASVAINEECCWGGVDVIRNSYFTFNTVALGGYTGNPALVENCYFSNNEKCITDADKAINNCIFENNEYGLYSTERVDVSNSTFTNHSQVALYGGRGDLTNCIITNNNVGVRAFFEGFAIDNCNISNNQVGVELNGYYNGTSWYVAPVTNSELCNNSQYNVINHSICDVDIYTVCWCNSDSTTVENLIYDAYDNIYVGFVNYTLFSEDCSKAIFKTHKAEGYTEYLSVQETSDETIIYPNPATSSVFIRNAEKISSIRIYDYTGRLVMDKAGFDDDIIELNVSELVPSLYIVRLASYNDKVTYKRIIIAR